MASSKERRREKKTTVKAIKYRHTPGWIGVFSYKMNFSVNSSFPEQRAAFVLSRAWELGLSIESSVRTNHTCIGAKEPQNPATCYNETVSRDCKTVGVSVSHTTIRGSDLFEFSWPPG